VHTGYGRGTAVAEIVGTALLGGGLSEGDSVDIVKDNGGQPAALDPSI